ncbi:MAG: hypothetical protein AMXMBFR8_12100 [Nevskiales bacterium]
MVNVSWFFISHRLELAKAALRAGYDVHVATRVTSAADADRIRAAGLVLHHIEIGRGDSGLLYDLRSIREIFRLYKTLRPDLTHHVALKPVVFGGLMARMLGMRRVVQAVPGLGYGFVGDGMSGRLRRLLLLGALRLSCRWPGATVILQNAEDLEALVDAGAINRESAVLVRGSGVAVSAIQPLSEPDGPVRVVFASRMLREKGLVEFVEAARLLRAAGENAEFLLAGVPDDSNPGTVSIEQLTAWHRSGVVNYLGFVSDIPALLLSSHLVCLPTYYGEGVPKILIEAAACGRAIITTDRPGCRDIVREGVNGCLVKPRDARALADAMKQLIRAPELRREYGLAGRQLAAAEFDLSIIVGQTLALYEKLLERPCRSW